MENNKFKFLPQFVAGIAGGSSFCLIFLVISLLTGLLTLLDYSNGDKIMSIFGLIISIVGSYLATTKIKILGNYPVKTSLLLIIATFIIGIFGLPIAPNLSDTQGITIMLLTILSFPISAISSMFIIFIQKKIS
ncbi:MAG: hypothetical protein ACD_76C00045G0005 [uncultured bacterium]|nr:MAG: hypothetical protein ACD_76C00045G0005 [uncultured bacterium]HBD05213.1 hypothetical protein [Candidatus Uhrbacteria bacterium]